MSEMVKIGIDILGFFTKDTINIILLLVLKIQIKNAQ